MEDLVDEAAVRSTRFVHDVHIDVLLSLALAVICIMEIVYLDKWTGKETTASDAQYLGEAVMIAAYLSSALLLVLSLR